MPIAGKHSITYSLPAEKWGTEGSQCMNFNLRTQPHGRPCSRRLVWLPWLYHVMRQAWSIEKVRDKCFHPLTALWRKPIENCLGQLSLLRCPAMAYQTGGFPTSLDHCKYNDDWWWWQRQWQWWWLDKNHIWTNGLGEKRRVDFRFSQI